MTFELVIKLVDQQVVAIPLTPVTKSDKIATDVHVLRFDLPVGEHIYLSSKENASFSVPPEKNIFGLEAERAYTLRGNSSLEEGEVTLWIIEYDANQRLQHYAWPLNAGSFEFNWRTHEQHRSLCLALRVSGNGMLRINDLEISLDHLTAANTNRSQAFDSDLRFGPRGDFRIQSIFFDPVGYRAYTERHRHYYDDRQPGWYDKVASELANFTSVLDIGCGPGLLMRALQNAGIAELLGIERDPHYLAECRRQGLPVIEHDLNSPFTFVQSARFDAAIIHHALDYLAPIAIRNVLRECRRMLKPGGQLKIYASSEGQSSGDPTRTVPLTNDLMHRLLTEAGFERTKLVNHDRSFRLTAYNSNDVDRWETRSVRLRCGHQLRPWHKRQSILSNSVDAWDHLSNRDFTLLTSPAKQEMRVNGQLVAYYTGYRQVGQHIQRAICRAVSQDGISWQREPDRPVLQAGDPGAWDAGGVAAGSVIETGESDSLPLVMFYSGRDKDGVFGGVCIARSADGIHWEKDSNRVLRLEDYVGLQHLALADVIKTSSGRWLMHCEGMTTSGWAIMQAESNDGVIWQPTQTAPVIEAGQIAWGSKHIANPKCLEVQPGHYLMGFNATDASQCFQLGLAESTDGFDWTFTEVNPVICTSDDDYRIESFFMTRSSWEQEHQRVYYFRSTTRVTATSSESLTAQADPFADWLSADWQSDRIGLYRISQGQLVAESGAIDPTHAVTRTMVLDRETQCSLQLSTAAAGRGFVSLCVRGKQAIWELKVHGDGECARDGEQLVAARNENGATSICLRILRPESSAAEATLLIWSGSELVLDQQWQLGFAPEEMTASVQVPPGEPALTIDHIDFWQPEIVQVESYGDAHMYMGLCRTEDPLLPDIGADQFLRQFDDCQITRALVMPFASNRLRDGFDEIGTVARQLPGRVYPLFRLCMSANPAPEYQDFLLNQLELLWQQGLLFGLKILMKAGETPKGAVLDWLESRQAITFWHITNFGELQWLEENILNRYTFPVLLSHFAGYPLDRQRYAAAIELLDQYNQLYLVTSVVWFAAYLAAAIKKHPDRVLLGSDSPAVNPVAARSTIIQLDVSAESKTRVVSENLRFLTDRAQYHRWNMLLDGSKLRFPPVPENAGDLSKQGFEIVEANDFPPNEIEEAKQIWSGRGLRSFYKKPKPWSRWLAELVKDLAPTSVLEFGCNEGRNLAAIAEIAPDIPLVGIDVNADAIRAGRENLGLDLRHADENGLDEFADGQFDLVFTVSVLDHIPDIAQICKSLVRCAARYVLCMEVTLPIEGKVIKHFDHKAAGVRPSTEASYSWCVDRFLATEPRVWRLDQRPCYMIDASLGPYYKTYLAFLDPPTKSGPS